MVLERLTSMTDIHRLMIRNAIFRKRRKIIPKTPMFGEFYIVQIQLKGQGNLVCAGGQSGEKPGDISKRS